jgi:hypothetical protein
MKDIAAIPVPESLLQSNFALLISNHGKNQNSGHFYDQAIVAVAARVLSQGGARLSGQAIYSVIPNLSISFTYKSLTA